MKTSIYTAKRKLIYLTIFLFSCNGDSETNPSIVVENEKVGFEMRDESVTGINFINQIIETETFNYQEYEDLYSGGGVGIGDINNDGLEDIYLVGNRVSDKLYLNKGNLKFEDITPTAFKEDMGQGWNMGVAMVDLNADGWLDIYISRSGERGDRADYKNYLFINNKDNTFSEEAEAYGLAIQKRTYQTAFFDYDNDGDLDAYLMNHPFGYADKLYSQEEFLEFTKIGPDSDMLLENQDGVFVDVTVAANVQSNLYGLGVAVSDFNQDGFQDIYISCDYQDPDLLYINNGDKTFTNTANSGLKHTSNFSMGNEVADFNNDGFVDIMTTDMAAEDHVRSKRNMSGMSQARFWDFVNIGFNYQYMFNCLQLNNGNGTFSDVGQLAGVSQSDWSWAPLFADFDNDGLKDLFISNGYRREVRDNDYNRAYDQRKSNNQLGSLEEELELIPTTKLKNYIYKNKGELKFEKVIDTWGLDDAVNTNGAAYADLDNDGDLDLVLNNMDEQALIYENVLKSTEKNYLRVAIDGYGKNTLGIGAKVTIYTNDGIQFIEKHVTRGYLSSVANVLHFGLGELKEVHKIEVVWPDQKMVTLMNPAINQTVSIQHKDAKVKPKVVPDKLMFQNITDSLFTAIHTEIPFDDFKTEILLPNKLSQAGPFIAQGDVDGDGLEDFYITAPIGQTGKLYIQTNTGFTTKKGPWEKEKDREEMDAVFFDADNDGDLDLYVVSGGNEYFYDSPNLIDQLYLNDGLGNFKNESNRIPQIPIGGQSVLPFDYDRDGDLDLYVGGRQIPGYYPYVPKSYLFQNNEGFFKDVTMNSPDLEGPGLVTDAIADDFDQDGDLDLVVVGEFMPVTFYENKNGIFNDVTLNYNSSLDVGWWYSIEKGDFNGDGRMDYVVGNLGENNKFHPSKEKPLEVYCSDFDENGTNDIVLAKYQNNVCYPVRGRQCSSQQMPFIENKFPTYAAYAVADLNGIYGEDKLDKALHFTVTSFSSVVFLSEGKGYAIKPLPVFAQLGPVNKAIVRDLNNDKHQDLVLVGNNYGVEVETIRYDGSRGVVLLGDGAGNFQQMAPHESGFFENADCKDMANIRFKDKELFITVSNQAKAKTFLLH